MLLAVFAAALVIWWRFTIDMREAHARITKGSVVVETRCGCIEYQEAGTGIPLLSVHGSGGGFDQARDMAAHTSIDTDQLYDRRNKALKMDDVVLINLRGGKG